MTYLKTIILGLGILVSVLPLGISCKDDTQNPVEDPNPNPSQELPEVFNLYTDAVNVYLDGNFVVLESRGIPDHNSPYFPTNSAQHAAYDGSNPMVSYGSGQISTDVYRRT